MTLSPSNVLDAITAERRRDVEEARRLVPEEALRRAAEKRRHHSLIESLRSRPAPRIVAEVKKASPSAGVLIPEYDPAGIARQYEAAGAAGISVLTEPRHFLGSADHLCRVRAAVSLPILRKDFISDPYQVCEAAAWGADVVLLIVAALDRDLLARLHATARELGLDAIVEVHTAEELSVALECEGAIVGVNSRDLKTLRTDLAVAMSLAPLIPAGRVAIAESGIKGREDIDRLEKAGYRGFLIGESLLRGGEPGEGLRRMRQD